VTPQEAERFAGLVDELDIAVAGRPDIIASPAGFVVGALVGAGRSDVEGTYRQLVGFGDVLTYVRRYVEGDPEATIEAIIGAILPAPPVLTA
jgi:hypothetical protein